MKTTNIRYLTQAALIAAIYVLLVLIFKPISFGHIQVRIAEALTILPFFVPSAIPGLFVGCLLANFLGGAALMDIIGGSLATLVAAILTYRLSKTKALPWLAPLPPILANTLIIPFILRFAYDVPGTIPFLMFTIGIGEIISAGVLGLLLYKVLAPYKDIIFKQEQPTIS